METAIRKVAIAGAGVMGSAIAQYFAEGGLEVLVYDIVQASLDKIDENVRNNQQLLIERGQITEQQAQEARQRIRTSSDMNGLLGLLHTNASLSALENTLLGCFNIFGSIAFILLNPASNSAWSKRGCV